MKFIVAFVLMLSASPTVADVVFGLGGRPFTPDDWTVTGTALITPDAIGVPTVWTTFGSLGTASVAPSSGASGIVVDVNFAGWTSSRSLSIIDDTGQTRLEMWMTNNTSNRAVHATAMGIDVGEVPYRIGNTLRATFVAPPPGASDYQWLARIEDLGVGISAEHREPGSTPLPFTGPITIGLHCGYAVSGTIQHVVVLGDNVVPAETSTWGTVKALFR